MHVIRVRKIGKKLKKRRKRKIKKPKKNQIKIRAHLRKKRGGYLPRVHPDNIFTQARGYDRDSQGRLWKDRP